MAQTAEILNKVTLDLTRSVARPFAAYPHQANAWTALDKHFFRESERRAGVVIVPTGGGKTQLAARWLLKNWLSQGGRVLWLSHRRSLLVQAFSTFQEAAALASGGDPPLKELSLILVSGEDNTWSSVDNSDDVVFATMQCSATESAQGFLKLLGRRSGPGLFVVVDEAHHITAPSYRRVLDTLDRAEVRLLGLTATPTRMLEQERKQLWNTLDGPVYEIHKQELITAGILAIPHLITVETRCDFESQFTEEEKSHLKRFGELAESVLRSIGREPRRNRLIVEEYSKNSARYGKTLVFAVDIAHAITLAEEFKKQGVRADYVASNRADNDEVMRRYLDADDLSVLINVEMLTEGFDAPKTQSVFLVRPTRSEALINQMIGRALRGPQAQGTEHAFIVSFADEWKEFDVFGRGWIVEKGEVVEKERPGQPRPETLPVPAELIMEAYRLVQSRVNGELLGKFECFPERWYSWSLDTEDGVVERRVLVLDHQAPGFRRLRSEFDSCLHLKELDLDLAQDIVDRCFHDCPDPLPRPFDILELLQAWTRDQEVADCSFEDRSKFDPFLLARRLESLRDDQQVSEEIRKVYEEQPVCQALYGGLNYFYEEVMGHVVRMRAEKMSPPRPPVIVERMKIKPRTFKELGQPGYDLFAMKDALLAIPAHQFKGNEPEIRQLEFSDEPMPRHWGWCTMEGRIRLTNLLDSPDIPRFVVEFVLYHELLHAAMWHAGHNSDFRARERRFQPSSEGQQDASERGHAPAASKDAWRVLAEQYLDTFERFHIWPGRERQMGM